jgi:hypothetical protein
LVTTPNLALLVPDDRSDRIGRDGQLVLQAFGLVHRRQRGRLLRVPDRDQVRHPYLLACSPVPPALLGTMSSASTGRIEVGLVAIGITRTG